MAINYKQCPKCGSKKVKKILYGEPAYSLELMREESEGKILFGGCLITEDHPDYFCAECEHEWNKKEAIDEAYKKITVLKYSIGGFSNGYENIEINLSTLRVRSSEGLGGGWNLKEKTIDKATAQQFIEELKRIDLLNWKSSYVDTDILDGTQWTVEMVREGRNLYKSGSNRYPVQWAAFCTLMRELSGSEFS